MFKEFFERRHIKKVFQRLVSPEVVDELLAAEKSTGLNLDEFKGGVVESVLVMAGGAAPGEINAKVGAVCDIGREYNAMHWSIVGPLVVLGNCPFPNQPTFDRLKFVEELRRKLGGAIKIVHGSAPGHWGLLGSSNGIVIYSFLVSNFSTILGSFGELKDGEVREVLG